MNKEKHKIGLISLTAIGIGTMIGSGWLFSSYYAAKIAGPGSYIAWLFASITVLILGLCLSEIASVYPKRGLMARLLVISHNKDFAFVCTMATWLGLSAVIATEAEGSIQYLSSLSTHYGPYIFNSSLHQLTYVGIGFAFLMIFIFGVLNFWGIKLMSHSNLVLTMSKIAIPIITSITIIYSYFDTANFRGYHHSIIPYGMTSVFIAMISAGMIYSFNGFQNIVSFSSEVKKPQRDIPLAMCFSILITLIVYLVLESAFMGSITPAMLVNGWHSLNFTSPFVQITAMLNLNLITAILYVDAVTSPSGTGLIYTGSTTRMLTAMSQDKQMPNFFNRFCEYNFSRRSLIFTICLAMSFLLLFRSWAKLVTFLSLFYIISYLSIPICLGKLRAHKIKGKFYIPFAKLLTPIIFVLLSILYIFSEFPYTVYVAAFSTLAYIIYLLSQLSYQTSLIETFKKSYLMLLHVLLLAAFSYLGPKAYGGINLLTGITFYSSVIIVCLLIYYLTIYGNHDIPDEVQLVKSDS